VTQPVGYYRDHSSIRNHQCALYESNHGQRAANINYTVVSMENGVFSSTIFQTKSAARHYIATHLQDYELVSLPYVIQRIGSDALS
jgi:hypothetical protein